MPENQTIDKYSNNFLHIFNQILDIHAPETEVKTNKNTEKRNAKPWISNEIINKIKTKDKTYKRFINEKNPVKKEELYESYKNKKMR